jgi:hypothetical protein
MKSYSKVEMSEAEFIALVTLADTMMQRLLDRTVLRSAKPSAPIVAEEPAPSPVPPRAEDVCDPDDVDAVDLHAEIEAQIEDGTRAWAPVVRTWAQNFEVEDAPQPDRAGSLMAVFNGHGRSATAYIRERGGLAGACIDTLARENIVAPDAAESIGKRIALNMVQVGTAIGLPIDHLIERSLLRRENPDTLPLHGGLLGDTVDMTRPVYGNNEKA